MPDAFYSCYTSVQFTITQPNIRAIHSWSFAHSKLEHFALLRSEYLSSCLFSKPSGNIKISHSVQIHKINRLKVI